MALINDIEFYGRAVDAEELSPEEAARQLADSSRGGLTPRGAAQILADWRGALERYERGHADTTTVLRALRNGRPAPEFITRRWNEEQRAAARRLAHRPQERP
ncbi:hypothetical protein [Streptomyces sp. MH60]|uniref:hypothetical protein n=1 Tax=Streptomyces sp. MH60 TaxID=1940758 RepID=UPI000CEF22C6|nr:hypothetical protein [Streptomyces sp. MH60]PPS89602.1 hypothetical protein BZZ08_01749 [Streptomyces sp. MH60]